MQKGASRAGAMKCTRYKWSPTLRLEISGVSNMKVLKSCE